MSTENENKGVSAETAAALSATSPRPSGSGLSASIADAPAHDPLHTKQWVIHSEGDWTVGIPHAGYTIDGEMWFNDGEEKEEFRELLTKAFELVCDPVSYVKTIEEERAMYAAEQAYYDRLDKEAEARAFLNKNVKP